jgi:putative phosphoesterase
MKRGNRQKVTAILTADWHLRDVELDCRIDNFQQAQWRKVDFISELQKKYNCPVWHSGDLYEHWKPSPYLLTETIKYLPEQFHTVYGNHDQPQHNMELVYKSGINTLATAGKLTVMSGTHYGDKLQKCTFEVEGRKIAVWHVMTYKVNNPWPGNVDTPARGLIRKHNKFDLILTGHNHKTFIEKHEGRLLVNPGSITRQASDQADHKPVVFLYYAESNTVEEVELPYDPAVVVKPPAAKAREDRQNRIDAFVERLDTDWTGVISFKQNLEMLMERNEIDENVKQEIHKAYEQI